MAVSLSYQQELVDAIPIPLFFIDVHGTFLGSNQAFSHFIGKPDDHVRQDGVYRLLAGDQAERHRQLDQVLLANGTVHPFEDDALGAGGRRFHVVYRKALVHDSAGEVTGIVTTMVDLTDLKAIEQALVASESQKKAILDGFPGMIALFDRNLGAIWVNDTVRRSVNMPIGRLCHEIICKSDHQCGDCAVPRSVQTGEVRIGIQRIEQDDSGAALFYEIIGTPVKNASGVVESVIVIARDVTERFKLEKQLRHAQKMEAIGTLAGGIAHDFNNILTPIMGYAEILKLKMQQKGFVDEAMTEYLGEILRAGKRAKGLVEQILAFSRNTEQKESPQHLHPIVKEVVKLLRSTLPSTIQIKQNIDEKCGPVRVDPVQIHQVLINLCTNSADAIGEGHGVLTVAMKKVTLAGNDNEWLELSISDTGCGMNRELRERIFEPYFSTKEKGRGTGMGLALVHSIITRHEGRIEVESEEGVGSVFRIYLPITEKPTKLEHIVSPEQLAGGEGRIMLVDDEKQVVQVTAELLRSIGYQVSGWTSSLEAIEHFQENPEGYDLVLTDLTMPHLTGTELSSRIKQLRPDIPIILFTGYSERLSREAAVDAGIDEYCMKPVSLRDLARTVSRLLVDHH
ncbi:MAG: response regulator [Desulfofustis sp.]|nr:response regulator [Desulfofustis sp.]